MGGVCQDGGQRNGAFTAVCRNAPAQRPKRPWAMGLGRDGVVGGKCIRPNLRQRPRLRFLSVVQIPPQLQI